MKTGIEKVQAIINEYRDAAALTRQLIPIIKKFDHKVYNKRLQTALQDGTKKRIYCEKNNYIFRIYVYDSIYNQITLSHLKVEEALPDGKRLEAAVIIESINNKYSELLSDAYELEKHLPQVDLYKSQLEYYKNKVEQLTASIPYQIKDIFDLHYRVRKN